ncbi:MAG: UPF0149 family protein [Psychrobium sp.]|nr:UPF0149 family protein [Psychrobium sp.]
MQSLTNQQQQQLSSWLNDKAPNKTLSLHGVKGYLFAVICSPDPIDVAIWLPTIFNGDTENLPDEITMILAHLYNQITEQVFESGYCLPPIVEYSDMCDANFLSGHPLHEWSFGFACGVHFYSEKLLETMPQDAEISESFALAIMAMSFFADKEMAQTVVNAQEQTTINQFAPSMFQMIVDFAAEFAQLVEHTALSTGLYDEDIADDEEWDTSEF